jgi:hypothetical protein
MSFLATKACSITSLAIVSNIAGCCGLGVTNFNLYSIKLWWVGGTTSHKVLLGIEEII